MSKCHIHLLVCTHFDVDHAGNHAAFPNAELVVQKKHYEHALPSQNPRFALTRAQWTYPGARSRFVEGDVELVPGLELIATDGHCLGHQSVLIRLPKSGPLLLAIDAVASANSFTPEHGGNVVTDPERTVSNRTAPEAILGKREKGILLSRGILACSFYVYSFFVLFFLNLYSPYRTFQVRYYITPKLAQKGIIGSTRIHARLCLYNKADVDAYRVEERGKKAGRAAQARAHAQ